ncbi:MAG: hypothetical protein BYD32DRAFT_418035 [Podila humilis]|nr:MAG: hypothetical protein BYD32DRAFT_418035 [Podila humilis]
MTTITPPPPSFLTDMMPQQQQQHTQPLISPSSSSSSASSCPSIGLGSVSFCPSSSSSSITSSCPHFDPSSTLQAMLFLDVTTIHGLVLYTVYLLHRLRFFRWRDTKAISAFLYRHLSFTRTVHSRALCCPTHTEHLRKDHPPSIQDTKTHDEEALSLSSLLDQGYQPIEPWDSKDASTTKRPISINDKLPAEVMILVFEYLSSSRVLQCMLVCRSWYRLLGPGVWRNPRVLWSRHWSRFYPILTVPNATTPLSSSPSSESSPLLPSTSHDTDEDVDTTSSVVSSGQLFTDRALAGIHELDRQEIERWIEWKKRDKIRRQKTIKRRRVLKQRQQTSTANDSSSLWCISGRTHHRRRISDLEANHGDDESRSRQRQRHIHINDSSDESEEDDRDHISFGNYPRRSRRDEGEDLDDDSGTDSDYDPSDDETTLLKVVQGIDYLQSLLRQRQDQPTPQQSPLSASAPSFFALSRTLARLRKKQTAKEARLRMLHLRRRNGLPHAFPLATCGQWIQVINLHQETPYPQRSNPQSLVHPSTPQPRPRPSAVAAEGQQQQQAGENLHNPAQLHEQQQAQPQQPRADHPGFFSSFFGTDRFFQQSPEPNPHPPVINDEAQRSMDPVEQPRLQSRRDYVTDRTLATILQCCPGLCRLLVSECAGITDRGLEMIRNSECVRRRTLVSLHMAGCFKITDKGLLILATGRNWDDSDDANLEVCDTTDTVLRLESLDFAGCFQISDRGLVPLLKACGNRLEQLRVSDCDMVTSRSVMVLAQWCPQTKWLDLARSGPLTGPCLSLLAQRCLGLEWLNLARSHPSEWDEEALPQGGALSEADIDLDGAEDETDEGEEDAISDNCIALICESCPRLQLLDLSYIPTLTNEAIEAMSYTANALVCLTIIGCPGITSLSLVYLAKLRNTSGRLGCITMGDALGISEKDIEQIMQGTLSGWQKSLLDETSLGDILGRSWDE